MLATLSKFQALQKVEKREIVKIFAGITDNTVYDRLEKEGKIPDSLLTENFFESVDSNMNMAELTRKLDTKFEQEIKRTIPGYSWTQKEWINDEKILSWKEIGIYLETLPENKKVFLQKIGNDNCFVTKNDDKYVLSINGKTEICSTQEEVENYIDSRKFFHEIGCGFMVNDMDQILRAIHMKNVKIGESFDTKQGLSSEKKIAVMKTIARTMKLPLVCDGVNKNELQRQFGEYNRNYIPLQSIALEQKFIANGGFALGNFLKMIPSFS